MASIVQDVRFAVRALARSPTFTLVAVVTLALGFGANSAMFAVVNAVLIRPLPFSDPDRLMRVARVTGGPLTIAEYDVLKEQTRVFSAVAAYRGGGERTLGPVGNQDSISVALTSTSFLRTLGVVPLFGREFNADEARVGGPQAIVLTHRLWVSRFGADQNILGQTVAVNDVSHVIVGVLRPDFWFSPSPDVLLPLRPSGGLSDLGTNTEAIARLREGVSIEDAQSLVTSLTDGLRSALGILAGPNYQGLNVEAYQTWLVGDVQPNLLLLFGATAMLLLIASANLAMLLMSRLASRTGEIALRVALGSSRSRLLTQFLIEHLVITLLGAAGSILTAYALMKGLLAWIPFNLPAAAPANVDLMVMMFTLGIATAMGVVFTILPLGATQRINLRDALSVGGRSQESAFVRARTRGWLVVGEVALSTALLVGAGMLIQSLYRLAHEPIGFTASGLVTFETPFDPKRAGNRENAALFVRTMLERLRSTPGVQGVAATNLLPLAGRSNLPTQLVGHPDRAIGGMEIRAVTSEYFETMGISLRRGRSFTANDTGTGVPIAIINETLARTWWPNGGAIGERLEIGRFREKKFGSDPPREVVGVVTDTKTLALTEPTRPTVFVPMAQFPVSNVTWVVRTNMASDQVARIAAQVDPVQRVRRVRAMDEFIGSLSANSRFNAALFAIFAGLALSLASIGVYGVLSFLAARRRREIGLRIALGAERSDVLQMFLRQGLILVGAGIAIGLGGAFFLTQTLSGLLYGVGPTDLSSFVGVAVLLCLVGVAASYIPARRASRIDPLAALRYE